MELWSLLRRGVSTADGGCLQDLFGYSGGVFLKIFVEPIGEVSGHLIIGLGVFPGIAWIEQVLRNAGTGGWYCHAEDGMAGIPDIVELAVDRRGDHGTGIGERHTLSFAECAT